MSGAVSIVIGAVIVGIVTIVGAVFYAVAGTDHPDDFATMGHS